MSPDLGSLIDQMLAWLRREIGNRQEFGLPVRQPLRPRLPRHFGQ